MQNLHHHTHTSIIGLEWALTAQSATPSTFHNHEPYTLFAKIRCRHRRDTDPDTLLCLYTNKYNKNGSSAMMMLLNYCDIVTVASNFIRITQFWQPNLNKNTMRMLEAVTNNSTPFFSIHAAASNIKCRLE